MTAVRRAAALLLASGILLSLPAVVAGQVRSIGVRVVDVAGGRAYLSAGREQGISRGAFVRFKSGAFRVRAVSSGSAVLEQRNGRPRIGDRGRAAVRRSRTGGGDASGLPAPAALSSYERSWPGVVLPASTQQPEPVPLGPVRARTPSSVYLALSSAGILPLEGDSGSIARAQLRARITAVPWDHLPFSLTTDFTLASYFGPGLSGRPGASARRLLYVRELAARVGYTDGFTAAVGRLAYAATALGMMDGVRLSAPLGEDFRLAAFGGSLPNPLSGTPLLDASRFGAELVYEALDAALRPRVSLTAHGSYFDGALDERQLQATADFFPALGRFGGHVALRLLDEDNPWNAPPTQVYAAGAHAHFVLGGAELGGRVDVYRPERSRFLAEYLPPTFFCVPRNGQAEPSGAGCFGDELYITGQLDARYTGERVMLSLGATVDESRHLFSRQLGGFAHVRLMRLAQRLRLEAIASYRHGSLLRGGRLLTALGYTALDGLLDMSVHYQPAYLTYRADTEYYIEHGVGADLWFKALSDIDVVLAADLLTGRDVDVVTVYAQLHYRPAL